MPVSEYAKNIGPTEANRRFLHIRKEARLLFPNPQDTFYLKVGDQSLEVHLDKEYRIWEGLVYDLLRLKEGDRIVFSKIGEGSYELRRG